MGKVEGWKSNREGRDARESVKTWGRRIRNGYGNFARGYGKGRNG